MTELRPQLLPADLARIVRAASVGGMAAAPAFAEIHRRFVRVVHGIALARVGPGDAEDVTQDVFVRVHRALPTLSDAVAFPAWICKLARNVAEDHARATVRCVPTTALRQDVAARVPPEADEELRERVLRVLPKLPDAYRETLLLRLAEGLTGPEIADRTGLTPGSVRVNLCRGMEMLRALLRGEESR